MFHRGRGRRGLLSLLPFAAVAVGAILFATPAAIGQSAVDQYIPSVNPKGTDPNPGTGGSIATGTEATNAEAGSTPALSKPARKGKTDGSAEKTGSSSGELPGTGYPLTPAILVLIAAFTAALVAAFVLPRVRSRAD